jgi:hypothetical protein
MPQPEFPVLAIRSYADLASAFLTIKNFLGLSNECLEEIGGLAHGHADKLLGLRQVSGRLGEALLARAAAELGRKGAAVTNKLLAERRRLARRRNGHANGHAAAK